MSRIARNRERLTAVVREILSTGTSAWELISLLGEVMSADGLAPEGARLVPDQPSYDAGWGDGFRSGLLAPRGAPPPIDTAARARRAGSLIALTFTYQIDDLLALVDPGKEGS